MTIVMVSPNMKDNYRPQKEQWIPQEISYSLREQSRTNSVFKSVTSGANAMLAIVLPDRNGSYSYYMNQCTSCTEKCTILNTSWLFDILRENTFNQKNADSDVCNSRGSTIYHGESSYIIYVKWDDFVGHEEEYIERAYRIQSNKQDYKIHVQL